MIPRSSTVIESAQFIPFLCVKSFFFHYFCSSNVDEYLGLSTSALFIDTQYTLLVYFPLESINHKHIIHLKCRRFLIKKFFVFCFYFPCVGRLVRQQSSYNSKICVNGMITCKISPYPPFLAPIFYSLFLSWLLLTDLQKTVQTKGRTKVFYMNLTCKKCQIVWNHCTLEQYHIALLLWNWVLISLFFFFRHPHKFSSPEGTPTRLSKYLASPFLAIVEPEWNFDLSYILREENDFSLGLWEKYSFSLSRVLMFSLYGIQ